MGYVEMASISREKHGQTTFDLTTIINLIDAQKVGHVKIRNEEQHYCSGTGSSQQCIDNLEIIICYHTFDYEEGKWTSSTRARETAEKANNKSKFDGIRREERRQPWFASMDELGSFLWDFLFLVVALVNIGMTYKIDGRIDNFVLIVCIYDLALTDAQLLILIFDILFR